MEQFPKMCKRMGCMKARSNNCVTQLLSLCQSSSQPRNIHRQHQTWVSYLQLAPEFYEQLNIIFNRIVNCELWPNLATSIFRLLNAYRSEVFTIKFSGTCEKHCSGRHINSHSKRFGSKQALQQENKRSTLYANVQQCWHNIIAYIASTDGLLRVTQNSTSKLARPIIFANPWSSS